MKVFQIKNGKLTEFNETGRKKADDNEKLIQSMIEKNLSTVFPSLDFLTTEYTIDNLRPDSIAFDNDSKSFVIIEYKNVKHKGVVDQGMSYYKLLQEKKENFVLLYHKIRGKVLDVSESRFHNLSKEEKDYARAFANQLLTYSLNVIVKTLPKPFVKLLKDSAMPLNNLLEAIYDFARENNIKDIPQFRKLAFPITSRDY